MTRKHLQEALHSFGIFRHYCGYSYLQEAVELAAEEPARLHNIQKEIYFPIAKKYRTTVQNVEKDIRTVRDVLMRNGGASLLHDLTGYPFWSDKRPYPKELIGIFAECMVPEPETA